MPAISSQGDILLLQAREWRDTVGQSGMTPTAFSFLIPVFVVAIAAPFLCVFCIRKRRQPVPVSTRPPPKIKKPALRRAEAREKLNEVTEVSSRTSIGAEDDDGKPGVETRSVLERECAICLSTLHAPAPPEPAKLSPDTPITDAAALPASLPPSTDQTQSTDSTPAAATEQPESEAILKLSVCGHEFHAECLVSWFVLRKTSCPICRSMYMSKEAMEQHDEEERIALGGAPIVAGADLEAQRVAQPQGPPVSNWRYFLHGRNAFRRAHEEQAQGLAATQPGVEMQDRSAVRAEQPQQSQAGTEVPAAAEVQQERPARSRIQRFFVRG